MATPDEATRIMVAGLAGSGKTSILKHLKPSAFFLPGPTMAFNCECVIFRGVSYMFWDLAGARNLICLWKFYLPGVKIMWWCVDDNDDHERLSESAQALRDLLKLRNEITHFVFVTTAITDTEPTLTPARIDKYFSSSLNHMHQRGIEVSRAHYNIQGNSPFLPLFPTAKNRKKALL